MQFIDIIMCKTQDEMNYLVSVEVGRSKSYPTKLS